MYNLVFPANDADPMSRNKNVFTSVDRHLYLASVTYMAGKDKKKFRSHERQKKVQEDTGLLFSFC